MNTLYVFMCYVVYSCRAYSHNVVYTHKYGCIADNRMVKRKLIKANHVTRDIYFYIFIAIKITFGATSKTQRVNGFKKSNKKSKLPNSS